MTNTPLHHLSIPGAPASVSQPWQPRLQLFEQAALTSDRKEPVLYIHGATFPAENSIFFRFGGKSWADALNEAGFSVWGLDFPGFGRSEPYPEMASAEPPPGAPLGRAVDAAHQIDRAVRAIIRETGASKLSIIAHSWGTMAAARFASEHPELINRLVFFGPIVQRDMLREAPTLGPWRFITVEEQEKRFTEDVPNGEPGVLMKADFPAWADLYLKADPSSASRSPPSVKTPNGPLADIMSAWSGTLPYNPSRITNPVMIVRGEWDSLCNDADVAQLKQALSNAEVIDAKIPKATHLMHLESGRVQLYTATISFLNGRNSPN